MVGGREGRGNSIPPPAVPLEKVRSVLNAMLPGVPGSCVTRMLSRIKLVPTVLESGVGFEDREKMKVLPPPVRVKSRVSALAANVAPIRMTANVKALMGKRISLSSFQKMRDMKR